MTIFYRFNRIFLCLPLMPFCVTLAQYPGVIDPSFQLTQRVDIRVLSLAETSNGDCLVGGETGFISPVSPSYLFRVRPDGELVRTFQPKPNGAVRCITPHPAGGYLIGGDFTQIDNIQSRGIALINENGKVSDEFNVGEGFDGEVHVIRSLIDGSLFVGGDFTTYQGVAAGNMIRLLADGRRHPDWTGNERSDGPIYEALQATTGALWVGGQSRSVKGRLVPNLVRLNLDGSIDLDIMDTLPELYSHSRGIRALRELPDGNLLVGGDFVVTKENGQWDNLFQLTASGELDTKFM